MARTSRKKIKEGHMWHVTMSRVINAHADEIEKTVRATSQEDAIRQAIHGVPDGRSYTSIVAVPVQQDEPQMMPAVIGQSQAEIVEKFDARRVPYPYVIVLPKAFESVLRENLPKGVPVNERFGRLYVSIPTPKLLERFMRAMTRSKNFTLSETIVSGIVQSMR